jgi:ribosomal peptide maturation radical SAM protein 1
MPFGTIFYPSLGLSLLKASLAGDPVLVRVRYFAIRFAELIGHATYERIAVNGSFVQRELAGEWVFASALSPQTSEDIEGYVDEILVKRKAAMSGSPVRKKDLAMVMRVRSRVDEFLDECVEDVLREQPQLVGFTSVFQQHVASLALARRLKQACPSTFIVFGGANCEGPMGAETLRQFPFVDAVVSGDGDLVFPDLVRRVTRGESVGGLQGVRTRDRLAWEFLSQQFPNAPPVRNMDALPYPDYSDYFEQYNASRLRRWVPGVLAETSRGCWWGERKHCTFCGLNGTTMTYRSKSPARALDELQWLSATYPNSSIQLVDNILDMGYFKTLLPELASRGLNFQLFFETKSNLHKEHVRILRAAGVYGIQPGIESFSDPILNLMQKGVSGIQNVQLLKWCKELGVEVIWNLIWGFAGEPAEEYERMTALVPSLMHLAPPYFVSRLRLDRFSPNFADAERLGFTDVRPLRSYRYVYRLPEPVLANLAYYFAYGYRDQQEPARYAAPLLRSLARWQRAHARCDLFSVDLGECLLIWDLRTDMRGEAAPVTVLDGLERRLYLACDAACELDRLVALAEADGGGAHPASDIAGRLEGLVRAGLMMQSGRRYLSLAIPLGEYRPPAGIADRFYHTVIRLGGSVKRGRVVVPLDRLRQPGIHVNGRSAVSPPQRRRTTPADAGLTADHFTLTSRGDLVIRG